MSSTADEKPSGGRVRDPRPNRNRTLALDAAKALLVESGWDAVTHLAVADRSGLGRTTLYRFWPERADLLHDLIESELPSNELVPTGDLRADFVAELLRLADRVNDSRTATMTLTVMERAAADPQFAKLRTRWHLEGTSGVRALIRDGVAAGLLRQDIVAQDAVDQLAGPLVLRGLFAAEPVTPDYVERTVDRFLHEFEPERR
ncbi:TetR/AcrR family transcriptional regulator C-terminal ligand-binding domain-containing protein [Streptomyces sp. NPDC055105]|uniref:TetR/AcrR family transcriptional regulator n=1 Tax=Streptomyces sp. NPDC055105 TaxID=3365719 RepID=UPI0037D55573